MRQRLLCPFPEASLTVPGPGQRPRTLTDKPSEKAAAMRRSLTVVGWGLLLAVSLPDVLRGQGGESTGGARPVYVRFVHRVWNLPPGTRSEELLGAMEQVAKEHRLTITPLSGEEVVRLTTKKRLTGPQLDRYCEYPIRNLEDWDPMSTFARDYLRAHRENWEHDWKGEVLLDFYLAADQSELPRVMSYCYFYLRPRARDDSPQGGLFATSLAVYEQPVLRSLSDSLGLGVPITVEALPSVEPDLESVEFFGLIQENCGRSGVYVHPETGEVSCTPPGAMPLLKKARRRADD